MPTIRALGIQIVPLVLIFRGTGEQITAEEWAFYDSLENITVVFQPKAWCDQDVMLWYLTDVLAPALIKHGLATEDQLILLDNLGSHKTPTVQRAMDALGLLPFYTAPGCTDVGAPVDHHVGNRLKKYMRDQYEADCEPGRNYDLWRNATYNAENEALCAKNRRKLMAKWAADAWNDLILNNVQALFNAFLHTGG